jgi:hypothetical protein
VGEWAQRGKFLRLGESLEENGELKEVQIESEEKEEETMKEE